MSPNARSPHPKPRLRQVLIRLAIAVIAAAVIAFKIPHSLIPVFKESVSEATPPPEIQKVLPDRRKIVTVGDSITEARKYPGGYVVCEC
ncbi:hypothetical protein QUA54_03925 [Microcoleus sp. MOSTC5]|uniref:hypothetical protein n=1 Tax=Microcoleus sp. MOSTC5 TaxID=3055378 RepID=UPI002FD61625